MRSLIQIRITKRNGFISNRSTSICKDLNTAKQCLSSMTTIELSTPTRPITISLLCVSQTLLHKWMRYWQFTYQPYIYPTTLTKEEIQTIIGLCYIALEFQPKKKNWIYRHSTGFINYTSVLTNRLYCWVCQMVHETSSQIINIQYIFYQWSKPDFRITVTLGVVYIRCAFWRNIKIC